MKTGAFRWGLAGYGDLAEKRVAAALRQSGELVAVWGRNPGRAADFARRHDIARACATFADMLSADIDGVYVCVPPAAHAELTRAAAASGRHVLVEKPMAMTSGECDSMIASARASGVTLGVAYYRRAFPKMAHVHKLISEGVLGEPVWAHIASHSWYAPAADDPKHWRVEKAASGGAGALADIGVHRLDLLDYWLPGATLSDAVFTNIAQHYEVEDGSSLLLRLTNGAPVHAFFSWNSKTWQDRFEITGTEGRILIEPLDGPDLVVVRGRDREALQIPPPENAHLPLVEDFVAACREGRAPLCDGAAGLRVNALLEGAIRLAGK